jgi:uncharacterized protein YukE
MSAENIQVNFGNLSQGATTLQQSANTLQGYVENLLQSLQPLQQTWVESGSSAAEAMNTARTNLTNATDEIIQTINKFSTQVSAAHDAQYALEQQNMGLFTA